MTVSPASRDDPSGFERGDGCELDARFTALFRRYYDLVWRSAWRFGASAANVDDFVQETFLVALRRIDDFEADGRDPRGAWLLGILRYVMQNHRRSKARRSRRHREFGELPISRRVDEREAEAHLAVRLLAEFLAGVPPQRREIFVLAELGGYNSTEIGAMLELAPTTVRTRLHTTRGEFRAAFDDEPRAASGRRPAQANAPRDRGREPLPACEHGDDFPRQPRPEPVAR